MSDVRFLASSPRWLWRDIGVGTVEDDLGDAVSKPLSNAGESRLTASVFDRIVQQCGDCFVLVSTVFEDQPRHGQQVRDVWNLGPFANLIGMRDGGVGQRLREARSERHGVWSR